MTVPGKGLGDAHWLSQKSPERVSSVTGLASWHGCVMTASSAPSLSSVQALAANAVWHSTKRMVASTETTNLGNRFNFMGRMLAEPLGDCN